MYCMSCIVVLPGGEFTALQHGGLTTLVQITGVHCAINNINWLLLYDKKPAGCYKWNSPRHQTDYTQLTNSEKGKNLGKLRRLQ